MEDKNRRNTKCRAQKLRYLRDLMTNNVEHCPTMLDHHPQVYLKPYLTWSLTTVMKKMKISFFLKKFKLNQKTLKSANQFKNQLSNSRKKNKNSRIWKKFVNLKLKFQHVLTSFQNGIPQSVFFK